MENLAQRYPRVLNFSQKAIMNGDASAEFNKVLYVRIPWIEIHSPSHFYNFDEVPEQGNDTLNNSIDLLQSQSPKTL